MATLHRPTSLFPIRHITKTTRRLLAIVLLVLGGCCKSEPPPPPDLRVIGLEVTQAIQDTHNSVPLVTGKRTFVRVYVTREIIDHYNPPYLTAMLEGFRNGLSLGAPLSPANVGQRIYVYGEWDRRNLNDAFYFELPANWIQEGQITLKATIDPSHDFPENDYSNNIVNSGVLTFQPGKALRLHFVKYSYLRDGAQIAPSQFDIDEIVSQLRRMYPIPWLNYQQYVVLSNCGGGTNQISPPPCNSTYADAAHPLKIPSQEDVETLLLGLRQTYESNNPDALYFGLYALPVNVVDFQRGAAWWYDRVAVGWTHAGTVILDDRLENPGRIGTHEIGHLLGRAHVLCTGTEALPDATYPYPGGQIGGLYTQFMGFDSGDAGLDPSFTLRIIPPDWVDLMSYCDKAWISDYTYTKIYNYIQTAIGVTMLRPASHARSVLQNIAYDFVSAGEKGDYLSVYGTIDVSQQVASVSFLSRQTNVTKIPIRKPGAYHILLLNAQDKRLADYAFTPLHDSNGDTRVVIGQIVPFVPGTARVAIYSDVARREIASVRVSPKSPVVSALEFNMDARLPASARVLLNWSANDPDGDMLTYTLLYSFDDGQSWRVLATGITGSTFAVDTGQLEGTKRGYFRLIANDGVNTGFADSVPFSVAGKPPIARISNPANGNTYVYGQTVTLEGYGQDIEDGTLDDAHLSWSSNRDGSLGTGHLIYPSFLSVGVHTITLIASDFTEQTGTATVTITITQH